MKTMILLSGIPGCGKSTWTAKYKASHQNVHVVESDEIRKRLTGSNQIFTKETNVWDIFLKELQDYSLEDNSICIADATNLQNRFREFYNVNTPNYDKHILVYFDVPFDVAEKNNRNRKGEKIVPDYAMKRLEAELEPISDEVRKLYDEIIIVDQFSNEHKENS